MESSYEKAACAKGHSLEWVAEGFGICKGASDWYPWSLATPITAGWQKEAITGRNGVEIPAWVRPFGYPERDEAMSRIEIEIAARNISPSTLTPGPSYEEFLQAVSG